MPEPSVSTSFARYVVESPLTVPMVSAVVFAPSPPTDRPVLLWLNFSVPSRLYSFTEAVRFDAAAWFWLSTTTDLLS